MHEALADELISINAIYGPDTLAPVPVSNATTVCVLKIPSIGISLRLSFPADYPSSPPGVLGPESVGAGIPKGAASEIVSWAAQILQQSFSPDEPCVYDLVEQLTARASESALPAATESSLENRDGVVDPQSDQAAQSAEDDAAQLPPPQWALSAVITDRKSVFVGRAARAQTPIEARRHIAHLLATDRKVAKATHSISAWRFNTGVTIQDCNDDGEDAAGGRLLHLLQIMQVWNVVVVVSRWYGGVHLGADRFRIINSVAREALVNGGFDKSART